MQPVCSDLETLHFLVQRVVERVVVNVPCWSVLMPCMGTGNREADRVIYKRAPDLQPHRFLHVLTLLALVLHSYRWKETTFVWTVLLSLLALLLLLAPLLEVQLLPALCCMSRRGASLSATLISL